MNEILLSNLVSIFQQSSEKFLIKGGGFITSFFKIEKNLLKRGGVLLRRGFLLSKRRYLLFFFLDYQTRREILPCLAPLISFREQSLMLGVPIEYLKHVRNTSRKNSTRAWKKKFFFVKNPLFWDFLTSFFSMFFPKNRKFLLFRAYLRLKLLYVPVFLFFFTSVKIRVRGT